MKYQKWADKNIIDLTGKIAVITGANSGIGYYATMYLAYKGAKVVMACRNKQKALAAKENILKQVPTAKIDIMDLNLASLVSISAFKESLLKIYPAIDILINNAGIYSIPKSETIDGFEIIMGTNYLGTYALTCQLLPYMAKDNTEKRIVNVSSIVHKISHLDYEDFFSTKRRRSKIYPRSKLAILTFSEYLGNFCLEKHPKIKVLAAHPGVSATNLFNTKSGSLGVLFYKTASGFLKLFTHSPEKASLPLVYAAGKQDIKQNDYFGPRGLFEISGYPKNSKKSKDVLLNHPELIKISEELTGQKLS